MKYDIHCSENYDGKYRMGISIDYNYYTRIDEISYKLQYLGVLDNNRDFIKEMKKYTKRQNFTFDSKEKMNEAKEYINSLLIIGSLML